jgi:hypothetical protein
MRQGAPGIVVHGFPVTALTGKRTVPPTQDDAAPHEHGVTFSNLSKDKNAEFISWYAFTIIDSSYSFYVSASSHEKFSETGFNAAPFLGKGRKAKKIGAPIFSYASDYEFNLGIYSAIDGLPGNELAGGSALANDMGLTWVKVNIFLDAGQEYFFAVRCASAPCVGGWDVENINFTGSAVDYWHVKLYETYNFHYGHTYTYSDSSPWHSSTSIPATGAFVIK